MSIFKKITDIIMPPVEEEEIIEETEPELASKPKETVPADKFSTPATDAAAGVAGAAAGLGSGYTAPRYDTPHYDTAPRYEAPTNDNGIMDRYRSTAARPTPHLTVQTSKSPEFKMRIYKPVNFEQVTSVADDIKDNKACVVNYELVDAVGQRHIGDFILGVCYALDGEVQRITDNVVLYVPNGVDVADNAADTVLRAMSG